jgi:hypothetical protein
MRKTMSWLSALVVLALFLVACGPEMTTPTPNTQSATMASPPPTEPVGEGDVEGWNVLGSPGAPVTMVEYSDFQ